ncbi:MAG: catechol 2,3-dioxygenase-like lactoylglutathione lyase family enzyme [Halioglobus sp.]|jgi:catechol 2,3-dioxygenase-like lactoylglutathione lyase family enzyme
MRLDHVNIAAPLDLMEKVKDFYCAALLLETGPRPDFGVPGYWLYGDDKPIVHLIESDNHSQGDAPPHLDHVAFSLSGIEQYTSRLKSLDVEYFSFHNSAIDATQVFCNDPCGIGVEAIFAGETLPEEA